MAGHGLINKAEKRDIHGTSSDSTVCNACSVGASGQQGCLDTGCEACSTLIHDMQNYFMNAFTPGASLVVELIDHITELRSTCHKHGIPVVYSAQPGGQTPEERGLQLDFWGTGIDGGAVQKKSLNHLPRSAGHLHD